MPVLQAQMTDQFPRVHVSVRPCVEHQTPELRAERPHQSQSLVALIDTAAMVTRVSSSLVSSLLLGTSDSTFIDREPAEGGPLRLEVVCLQLTIGSAAGRLDVRLAAAVSPGPYRGCDLRLGQDFLSQVRFSQDGPGRVITLGWEPS